VFDLNIEFLNFIDLLLVEVGAVDIGIDVNIVVNMARKFITPVTSQIK